MRKLLQSLFITLFLTLPLLAPAADTVDINTADAQVMATTLTGVGLSKAQAIVAYRKAHGPFKSLEDLTAVRGIGERTIEKNRERMTLGPTGE